MGRHLQSCISLQRGPSKIPGDNESSEGKEPRELLRGLAVVQEHRGLDKLSPRLSNQHWYAVPGARIHSWCMVKLIPYTRGRCWSFNRDGWDPPQVLDGGQQRGKQQSTLFPFVLLAPGQLCYQEWATHHRMLRIYSLWRITPVVIYLGFKSQGWNIF